MNLNRLEDVGCNNGCCEDEAVCGDELLVAVAIIVTRVDSDWSP